MAWLAGAALGLLAAAGAWADTTVAFYSHGWGVRGDGYVYFPHAFVVVEHSATPGDPAQEESYGYTAVSQGPDVFVGPTRGEVVPANPKYRKQATLHFVVHVSDAQYQALEGRVAAWDGPASPLYDLNKHNCIGFVADLATAIGLSTPPPLGRDPSRFLETVKQLNAQRLLAAAP